MKRKSERIAFAVPVLGRLGQTNVAITDLSVFGAGVQHRLRLHASEQTNLTFQWREQEIRLDCRLIRTRLERHVASGAAVTIYHSGLRFVRPSERETNVVRRIISSRVARALREQRANAYALNVDEVDGVFSDLADPVASPVPYLNELMSVLGTHRTGYIRCVFEAGAWQQSTVDGPDQPPNGFTVAADEGDESIRMLCRAYESSSPEGRQLIQTFAYLTLTEPSGVPRDRFRP